MKITDVVIEGGGNFVGDFLQPNIGGATVKPMQVGDTVSYFGQTAKIQAQSPDRKHSRIEITKGTGGVVQTVHTSDLKRVHQGLAEGLDEAVGGNYLYHATGADGLKGILSSDSIRSATGPQAATSAQTKLPTVSVTRDWGYASGSNAGNQMVGIARHAVLVLDRNAVESNFKTLGTSQSTNIKGLSFNPYLKKDGETRSQNTDLMARANAKGKAKYAEPTAKAGGEFEEAVVVPKGALPLKGTMVGFWVNPKSELMKDPAIMNDPRRLDMIRPNQFVKATQQQGVAEGEVVPLGKKHRGDLDSVNSCSKCGGKLEGGTYMGQRIKVCQPCKQVYLPPNSGIDQQGNKIKEQGVDEEFRPTAGQAMGIRSQIAQKMNPGSSKFVWKRPNQIMGSHTENELRALKFRYSAKYNSWGGTQQMWGQLEDNLKEFAPTKPPTAGAFGGNKDYGQPTSSRYSNGNKFVLGTTNNYVLTATVDKWGLEWDEDNNIWYLDSPGAAHIADATEGEIELPAPQEQRNQIHDLVTDYLNDHNSAELQRVAAYYGHSADGEMATSEGVRVPAQQILGTKNRAKSAYYPTNVKPKVPKLDTPLTDRELARLSQLAGINTNK